MNIKRKIGKYLKGLIELSDKEFDGKFKAKKFGESKSVAYEVDGAKDDYAFCQCTAWPNGEGYDFSFSGKSNGVNENDKYISLHSDQIEAMLYCLNDHEKFEL